MGRPDQSGALQNGSKSRPYPKAQASVSHRDFKDFVDGHAGEFGAAAEAMTDIIVSVLENRVTLQDADAQLSALVEETQRRSTQWAMSVLPAVVDHATAQTDAALSSEASFASEAKVADDSTDQAASLELAILELEEALHNIAHQMARDARGQIREGLRIEVEEQRVSEASHA